MKAFIDNLVVWLVYTFLFGDICMYVLNLITKNASFLIKVCFSYIKGNATHQTGLVCLPSSLYILYISLLTVLLSNSLGISYSKFDIINRN